MDHQTHLRATASILGLLALSSAAVAQTGMTGTAPLSPNTVLFDVTDQGEWVATLGAVDGGMAQLSFEDTGVLQLFPVLVGDIVEVRCVETAKSPERAGRRLVTILELVRGTAQSLTWGTRQLGVTWRDVRPLTTEQFERLRHARASPAGERVPTGADGPCVVCCVSCDGDNHCGCPVVTRCGSCCCPLACGCP